MSYEAFVLIVFIILGIGAVVYMIVESQSKSDPFGADPLQDLDRMVQQWEAEDKAAAEEEKAEEIQRFSSWKLRHESEIDGLKEQWDLHEESIQAMMDSNPRTPGVHLTAARIYRSILQEWYEFEEAAAANEYVYISDLISSVVARDQSELAQKMTSNYISHLASLDPGEASAAVRIEYAELGSIDDDNYGVRSFLDSPSGTFYAREAEQMIQQLLRKNPGSNVERLLTMLIRAINAQGYNVWDRSMPKSLVKKRDAAEARLAIVVAKNRTASTTKSVQPSLPNDSFGSLNDYGDEWPSIARTIKRRDGNRCTECGATGETLHVHHIIPLSEGGTHSQENLITLCTRCHANNHAHMN